MNTRNLNSELQNALKLHPLTVLCLGAMQSITYYMDRIDNSTSDNQDEKNLSRVGCRVVASELLMQFAASLVGEAKKIEGYDKYIGMIKSNRTDPHNTNVN